MEFVDADGLCSLVVSWGRSHSIPKISVAGVLLLNWSTGCEEHGKQIRGL